jgi:hypothetical protein
VRRATIQRTPYHLLIILWLFSRLMRETARFPWFYVIYYSSYELCGSWVFAEGMVNKAKRTKVVGHEGGSLANFNEFQRLTGNNLMTPSARRLMNEALPLTLGAYSQGRFRVPLAS